MAYRLPPLSTLRTFEAAARLLSFRKTADELHVTPAAVSQQIKTLESYLGVALFKRHPKALQLTEAGLAMFPRIRDGLDSFAAGIESTQRNQVQALNVTAPPAFATRWLVPRLARFSMAHPEVAIRITSNPGNIDGPQPELAMESELIDPRSDTCDISIRFGTGLYPGYHVDKIITPDYIMVCSPRLIAGDPPLRTPQDLACHILIHDESIPAVDKRPSWPEWLKLAGVADIDTERGPRFSNSLLALEAALEGQGLALVLTPQVETDLAAGRLVAPFSISMPSSYAYYLVMPEAVADQAVVLAFQAWLRAEIGEKYGV